MVEPAFPYVFALNGRSARSSGGEVLAFWEDKIELLHRGEIQTVWQYNSLEKLGFYPRKGGAGLLSLMLGSMGKSVEDEWVIATGSESLHFQLEIDSKYRKEELKQLCAFLSRHVSVFLQETKH